MSVRSTTTERLHRLVTSGRIPSGARLGEVRLAKEFGVSRPTMREALRGLEGEGLAASDGRSLRVLRMSEREVQSALLMRSSLEALHAELAAQRVEAGEIADAELRRIGGLADRAEAATEADDRSLAVELNRAFHQAIDVLADSPVSAAAAANLWDRILVTTQHSLDTGERRRTVSREHREILEAIAAGDSSAASAAAAVHVRATLHSARPAGVAEPVTHENSTERMAQLGPGD